MRHLIYVSALILSLICHAAVGFAADRRSASDRVRGDGQADEFRVEVEISNSNPYVGEAFDIVWYVIGTTADVNGFDGLDLRLTYDGVFSDTDIYRASVTGRDRITRIRDGETTCYKIPVGHIVAVGKKKGTMTVSVGDGAVGVVVPEYVRDPFWGNVRRDRIVRCDVGGCRATVRCKALPGNAPSDFSGAVGNFTVNAVVKYPELEINENSYADISVEGYGWIPEKASLDVKDSFRTPVKLKSVEEDRQCLYADSGFYSILSLAAEFSISDEGRYTIAPFRFVYFNPETKSYSVAESDPIEVVAGESSLPSEPAKALPI